MTWQDGPLVEGAQGLGDLEVEVLFSKHLNETAAVDTGKYLVISLGDQPDTLHVAGAELGSDFITVSLDLEESLIPGMDYRVEVHNMLGNDGISTDLSSTEFHQYGENAVLLASYSGRFTGDVVELSWMLSDGSDTAEFLVSRGSGGGESFVPIGVAEPGVDDRSFTFIDRDVEPGNDYAYRVEYSREGEWRVLFETEGIEVPLHRLVLHQNHPNPFNPSTVIMFDLPERGAVWLSVFDVSGRLVRRLLDGEMLESGRIRREWDGRNDNGEAVASGVYYYRLRAGRETMTRKMVLLR